jgi:chaperone modulatory protein CbpM
MDTQELIVVELFCQEYHVETSLIWDLEEFGLIETIRKDNTHYLNKNQIVTIEKIIRLHTDLSINKEGIEIILDLLNKIEELHQHNKHLRNRLDLYE